MNYKKIIVGFALSLACLSVQQAGAENCSKSKKKENVTAATSINWADASGKVSYSINATTAPVVKIALRMFSNDMKAVTGNEAKEKASANIQIYQLNQLTNKEFSAVEKLGAPLHKFITAKDAFYFGTRKGKIIVIGSDARGTAYAIMELSRMAGVSPMAGWNDLKPQPRQNLSTQVGTEKIEIPRIEFRGLALNGSKWMNQKNYSQLARLMLRLRANTLWQVDGKHEAAYNKAVVDSFDICIAENYKVTEITGKKHKKKHKKTLENVKMICAGNQMQLENVSPALVLEMLNNRDYLETKSEHREKSHRSEMHHDEDCAWIANVTNPKMVSLQLAMISDLAWNSEALQGGISSYLQNWLSCLFGNVSAKKIKPLMEDYYRLTSIR